MAVTNLTDTDLVLRGNRENYGVVKSEAILLDLSANDLGTADTHLLYGLPVGNAFLMGWGCVQTECAGGTSLKFNMGIDMSTVITQASSGLIAGSVFSFGNCTQAVTGAGTVGTAQYSVTTELDITMVVDGTFTAGIIAMVILYADITAAIDAGIRGDGLV